MKLLVIWCLLAGHISCSHEFSMKKIYNLGASFLSILYSRAEQLKETRYTV